MTDRHVPNHAADTDTDVAVTDVTDTTDTTDTGEGPDQPDAVESSREAVDEAEASDDSATNDDTRLVHLERLGFPTTEQGPLVLHGLGVPESSRRRLATSGVEFSEDPDEDVAALVVSTRLPPDELRRIGAELAEREGRTVVLAHTGAERLAADLVRAGANAVVGEGNEEALVGLLDTERAPTALLASFERRFGRGAAGNARGRDPSTGLPDLHGFEQRLGTLGDADEVPRVALLRVVSDRWDTSSPDAVVSVQRRRLASVLLHVATAAGVELYGTGSAEFGVIGPRLSPHDANRLGNRFISATGMFHDRGVPLRMVMGHAGSESANESEELLDLARRAVDVAAVEGGRQVLSAEDLALGVSVTTELEALVRLLDEVEPLTPEGPGHGERVGRIAAELARSAGSSPGAVSRIQLAGHLHGVGRARLSRQAAAGPDGLSGDLLDSWRTYPVASAELLQLTAGPAVAGNVRSHRERWDGTGFPDGIGGTEIPEGGRIIALARAIDAALATHQHPSLAALGEDLRARAGDEFDPDLVGIAVDRLDSLVAARG